MADSYNLTKLRLVVGADASEDELLLMYLTDAERAIINHLYPMDEDTAHTLPTRYESRMVEIAAYLYNKRGAEGEISHNENGLLKENIPHYYCGNYSGKVGKQATGECVARVLDSYATEIDCKNVECGVGRSLENARQTACEGVGAIGAHCIDHHSACTAAAQRLHNGGGQCTYKISACAHSVRAPRNAVHNNIHSTRCTEHSNGDKYGNEVGDYAHGGAEAIFCSLNEGLIDIDFSLYSRENEQDDYGEQCYPGK